MKIGTFLPELTNPFECQMFCTTDAPKWLKILDGRNVLGFREETDCFLVGGEYRKSRAKLGSFHALVSKFSN
jgi:hypothetical protein